MIVFVVTLQKLKSMALGYGWTGSLIYPDVDICYMKSTGMWCELELP